MEKTTIQISKQTKALLDELKIHPRETYDEVIRRLIESRKGGIGDDLQKA